MFFHCAVLASVLLLAVCARGSSDAVCRERGSVTDQKRFAAIRDDLMAKLNFPSKYFNAAEEPDSERVVDSAMMLAYEAAVRAQQARARESHICDQHGGRGMPSFAKRISLFFPAETSRVYPSPDILEKKEEDQNAKDGVSEWDKKSEKQGGKLDNMDSAEIETNVPPVEYTFRFDLASLPSKSYIVSSELRLFKRKLFKLDIKELFENINVYLVTKKKGIKVGRMLVTSKNVFNEIGNLESLDVTEAVKKWVGEGATEERLELQVVINCPLSTVSGLFYPPSIEFVTDTGSEGNNDNRAQLVVATVPEEIAATSATTRHKRQSDTQYCVDNPNRIHCCVRSLEVDFHRDLNMTSVIFPETFNPNYCQGLCPYSLPLNEILQTVRDYYEEASIGEEPCCAIYSRRSLILLLKNPETGNLALQNVPDMEIESCICV